MKIKPLFDNLVLSTPKRKDATLYIPDNDEKPDIAEVLAVGPGTVESGHEVKMQVKVGDKVLYNKYSANEFYIDNELFILIKQCDLLAIVDNNNKEI